MIVEVVSTLTASVPLPVLTLPVMFEAFSVSVSVVPRVVSVAAPRVTSPVTVEAALSVTVSEPEPVVSVAVIAVPFAVSASLPSLLLLSLPRFRVWEVPPIFASLKLSTSAPPPVMMLPVISDLVPDATPVTVRVSPESLVSVLEPRVTLPVILEPPRTLTASAPLPVVTLPVMLEALRVSESSLLIPDVGVVTGMERLSIP